MSAILSAVIQLAADVQRPRRRGWRCTCQFEEIVSADGERNLGVEITPTSKDEIAPGDETNVELRLWAPLSRIPQPETVVRLYEGQHLVASGTVTGVIEAEGA
ncbi:MAG: hypothetical protein ACLQNG_18045 [Acidimicrobiales bacterium]